MSDVRLNSVSFKKEFFLDSMKKHGLDGILLTSPENVYYTTGFPALPGSGNPILNALKNQLPFFAYLDAAGPLTLFCWIGATFGIEFGVDDVRTFFNFGSALDELGDFLGGKLNPQSRLGVEATLPFYVIKKLESLVGIANLTLIDDLFLQSRLCKSMAEIELLCNATKIVEQTVSELGGALYPGISRMEVIQKAKELMIHYGATAIDHTTIAFGSTNPEIALDEVLQYGQLVTLDLGAVVNGYVSDNRRLFYCGEISEGMRSLHEMLCGIVSKVGQALVPGAKFADLYLLAVSLYEEAGLPPFFVSVGHSIGLQVEEAWIDPESPYMVQPGMVLNIELYSSCDTGELIGDEETYLVTDAGPLRITETDSAIHQIG